MQGDLCVGILKEMEECHIMMVSFCWKDIVKYSDRICKDIDSVLVIGGGFFDYNLVENLCEESGDGSRTQGVRNAV